MQINVNGVDIFYVRHPGEKPVILLHGWGGSHISMQGVYDYLSKKGCDVINVDLPGFGLSPAPPPDFGVDDYAFCIKELIEKLCLSDITIIGHSFGGRIAILLGKEPFVKRLVLVSTAGIKPRFSLKKWIRVRKYKKAVKKGKDVSAYGSSDYKALNKDMQKVFVRIVNRHLDDEVSKIKVPTLLVWGKDDNQTPLYMAKKIKKGIADSGLVVLEGGHFAYAERHNEFCAITGSFLFN